MWARKHFLRIFVECEANPHLGANGKTIELVLLHRSANFLGKSLFEEEVAVDSRSVSISNDLQGLHRNPRTLGTILNTTKCALGCMFKNISIIDLLEPTVELMGKE